jgi:GntR family transcriptional regulator/MocR family aminotransferase
VPLSSARRLALLGWASRAGAWIIEDDYDCEFRHGAGPLPCLQGLDGDGRVLHVGGFAKSVFPALRLGFLVVPEALVDVFLGVRRAEFHPPTFDQAVLADFIVEGHYAAHLRRMRLVYRERLEALVEAADRFCRGLFHLHPARTGLHVSAELPPEIDDRRACAEAAARGVEVMPLSHYCTGRGPRRNGLVLGFGTVRPEALFTGMETLAAALEAARGPGR